MASPSIPEALETFRSVARNFQAVIDLADALGEVSSLEQANAEAKMRADNIAAQADAALTLLKKTQDDIEQARIDLANVIEDAQAKAEQTTSDAKAKATAIIDEATARAGVIIGNAYTDRDKAVGELMAITQDVLAKENELTETQGKLDRALAKINQLLAS